jgi:hypothetical protein
MKKEEEEGGRNRGAGTFPFAVNLVTRDHPQLVLPDVRKAAEKELITLSEILI